MRRVFLGPQEEGRRLYGISDAGAFARRSARRLRATAARYPDDPEVAALVAELLAGSEEFRRLWASHDVTAERTMVKTFRHPVVGPLTLNCDMPSVTECDQEVVIYTRFPARRRRRRCGCWRSSAPSGWTPRAEVRARRGMTFRRTNGQLSPGGRGLARGVRARPAGAAFHAGENPRRRSVMIPAPHPFSLD